MLKKKKKKIPRDINDWNRESKGVSATLAKVTVTNLTSDFGIWQQKAFGAAPALPLIHPMTWEMALVLSQHSLLLFKIRVIDDTIPSSSGYVHKP